MNKVKNLKDMTEEELKGAYIVGKIWVSNRAQMVGTNKNILGETYDNNIFLAGLKRIENIEDEIRERGLIL